MLKPLHDNVVLKKEKVEKKTASGIILTGDVKDQPSFASVIAVGEGAIVDGKLTPLSVKIGDKVVYKKYSTTEFKFEEEEYLIIAEKDILAILE
ncbi:MAG: co-chaperone GroES [Candidatus Izemoplasmatales bacterium]|jgi:chaperonin GroES|nr:co-chaperone GroES [Candidatus Izemoplasmatales bacterium]MDD4355291.1 co-chaperone GroES [Candidatus Izemoplasmatales bacterium]MDD4987474.1 co-chaperone GroES [Candidatus Izemoplasmatales bacterium]MDD5601929.1 co-chaperone GroES [Candidatus Izemoplasmatales bacterium]MDY0373564.1 co-chaperone GroES [Candidatus Izemoplasmatales bacterium]